MPRRARSPVPPQLSRSKLHRLRDSAQRAGPALPSYLALHHAGFSVPPVLPPERWALTPPFHPCQTKQLFPGVKLGYSKTSRRFPCAMPPCCCAGGLFSVALSVTAPHCRELRSRPPLRVTPAFAGACVAVPWHYQARCPTPRGALEGNREAIRHRLLRAYDDGVRTFLPSRLLRTSDHPAHPPSAILSLCCVALHWFFGEAGRPFPDADPPAFLELLIMRDLRHDFGSAALPKVCEAALKAEGLARGLSAGAWWQTPQPNGAGERRLQTSQLPRPKQIPSW